MAWKFRLGTFFSDMLAPEAPEDNNIFVGMTGEDVIETGTGTDFVYAGSNNDTIIMNAGYNHVFGGRNNDTFVINSVDSAGGYSVNYIGDFTHGEDVIDVSDTGATSMYDININFYEGYLEFYVKEQRVVLTGVEELTADDFDFYVPPADDLIA